MSKPLLNEAESLLLGQWKEAHLLERSMERVREKYNALYSQCVKAVAQGHPELDAGFTYMTQRWSSGQMGFSRTIWPEGESNDQPGFWMINLRLDLLVDESEPSPEAMIYIPPKAVKKLDREPSAIRVPLLSRAKQLLTADEFDLNIDKDDIAKPFIYFRTLSKQEVLSGINPEEGKGLILRVVKQFELMAKMIPALNELFGVK